MFPLFLRFIFFCCKLPLLSSTTAATTLDEMAILCNNENVQNGYREKAAAHIIILLNVQEGQFSHRWLPIWSFTPTRCLRNLQRNMIWNNTFKSESFCRHQITRNLQCRITGRMHYKMQWIGQRLYIWDFFFYFIRRIIIA